MIAINVTEMDECCKCFLVLPIYFAGMKGGHCVL